MDAGLPSPARHALHDALLRRLARGEDAEAFVVRGGVRVRALAPQLRRPAADLDLLCALPYSRPAVSRALTALGRDLGDGAWFGEHHLEPVWRGPGTPGFRLRVLAGTRAHAGWLGADLLFGLDVWPPPTVAPGEVPGCRAEAMIARKLLVTAQLGRADWRPKDLADCAALLPRADRRALDEAIDHVGVPRAEAREILGAPAWWRPGAWRWAEEAPWAARGLDATLAEVAAALLPVLG